MSLFDPIGVFSGGGLPMPPMPPGLPSLPGMPGAQPQQQGGGSLGGTMQTQPYGGDTGSLGYPQNIAGLLQMLGGNQANPANMNLMKGGLI